jgi:hypothetical protein
MGTRYDIVDPDKLFISFAIFHDRFSTNRAIYDEFRSRTDGAGLPRAALISEGPAIGIEEVMEKLGERGFHEAIDGIEGAVWIMETNGEVNGVAKFVKADKVDGKYLSGVTGGEPVVNYRGPAF